MVTHRHTHILAILVLGATSLPALAETGNQVLGDLLVFAALAMTPVVILALLLHRLVAAVCSAPWALRGIDHADRASRGRGSVSSMVLLVALAVALSALKAGVIFVVVPLVLALLPLFRFLRSQSARGGRPHPCRFDAAPRAVRPIGELTGRPPQVAGP